MTGNHMTARTFVAKELRRAREGQGMTQAALAKAVFASDSLVAAWESGRRVPKPQYVKPLIEILRVDPMLARMIAELVTSVAPEWFGKLLELEARAISLLTYEALVVPGLLQTEGYARQVLAKGGRQNIDIEEMVSARLERQGILSSDDPPMFVAIMDEGVLRRPVGGPKVMHEQLTHLLNAAESPDVMLQVVPYSAGAYPGLAGAFMIIGLEGREVVYVDHAFSGDIVEAANDVATMKRIWEALRVEALSGKQSIELLAEVAKEWA